MRTPKPRRSLILIESQMTLGGFGVRGTRRFPAERLRASGLQPHASPEERLCKEYVPSSPTDDERTILTETSLLTSQPSLTITLQKMMILRWVLSNISLNCHTFRTSFVQVSASLFPVQFCQKRTFLTLTLRSAPAPPPLT